MKKHLLALTLGGMMLFSTALAHQVDTEKGTISVNSSAEREFAPNVAEIYFTIETSDKDMQKAIAQNKANTTSVIEVLKANVDSAKGEGIRTTSYSVAPRYIYEKNKQIFDKYNVTNTLVVKIKDIEKLGKIISLATANGVNRVQNLNFTLENYTAACNELMSEAAQTSKVSAQSIANGLGLKLNGIKSINGSCGGQNSSRAVYKSFANGAVAETAMDSVVPIEAGKLKIYANVSAQFYAK